MSTAYPLATRHEYRLNHYYNLFKIKLLSIAAYLGIFTAAAAASFRGACAVPMEEIHGVPSILQTFHGES